MEESKRIRQLKENLIKELPFFPNEKSIRTELENQSLNGVLIAYLHWKTRIVPTRRRRVHIYPEVTSDKRWKELKLGIHGLLDKVRKGEDLYPHLSLRAHKYGYTPVERIRNGDADSWEDKDQLLNTKGFHHFHLSMNIQSTGLAERTNNVLFAFVSRDQFRAVGIFDHSVFDKPDSLNGMTEERERMWTLHEKYITFGMKAGTVYINNLITASGHPVNLIMLADRYAAIIREYDQKAEDRIFVNELYAQSPLPSPERFKFEWRIEGLDLVLFDKKNRVAFNVYKAHI
ncbi:TPA: hypothetical protein RMM48_004029 [Escherichia coli]|jgi:hypothetical protein|uniref:hypothetical protein n=1 Tax=Enterobacteriaceae TaxID=543 RepID=UPI000992BB37|nr:MULTISPECIES: hypothetical protein [Enterobacteriaceae]EKH5295269.1 hypothetical protein [Escherichia coli O26]EKH6185795.1 hypothetical protein [Escherichia coli O111]EKH6195112.1 hypothetical protein [Escherichia coli O103]EKJ1986560.1 hypothetical protein [Escherichia coli O104]EKY3873083.1 hypothetical protein [Escherichia coli O157]